MRMVPSTTQNLCRDSSRSLLGCSDDGQKQQQRQQRRRPRGVERVAWRRYGLNADERLVSKVIAAVHGKKLSLAQVTG